MRTWNEAFRIATRSGSAAAAISGLTLAACGKVERDAPAGPLNGPSQWVWGQRAARRRKATWRHTALGYAIHHLVSIGWATVHEKHVASLVDPRSPAARLLAAGATATIACAIDFGIARGRLRPGFKVQLSRRSLALVYAAFAIGLALGGAPRRSR